MKRTLRLRATSFACAILATILALVPILTKAAFAADPTYPPGARVGLVPLDGLVVAKDFLGFESEDHKVRIGIAETPTAAFATIDAAIKDGKPVGSSGKPKAIDTAAGKAYVTTDTSKDGSVTVRSFSLIVAGETFSGYVLAQLRDDAAKIYSDDDVHSMLASTAVRKEVPVAEQLGLLPFKIGELADFKTIRTLTQRATIMLTDGNEETALDGAPYMVIGLLAGNPASPDDRARFAQRMAATIPGLRDVRITSNEPMRIDGTPGFETRIDAVTGQNNAPISVVQWLRFGTSSTSLRIVASASREDWPKAFPRFRAVRDGIGPR